MRSSTSDMYQVTVWDLKANAPYMFLRYNNEEDGKYVARRMHVHYVEEIENSPYQVKLQRMEGTHDV